MPKPKSRKIVNYYMRMWPREIFDREDIIGKLYAFRRQRTNSMPDHRYYYVYAATAILADPVQ